MLATRLTKPLTEKECEILDWILETRSDTASSDPEFNVLRLKLFCLKEKNALHFAGKAANNPETPVDQYKLAEQLQYALTITYPILPTTSCFRCCPMKKRFFCDLLIKIYLRDLLIRSS